MVHVVIKIFVVVFDRKLKPFAGALITSYDSDVSIRNTLHAFLSRSGIRKSTRFNMIHIDRVVGVNHYYYIIFNYTCNNYGNFESR